MREREADDVQGTAVVAQAGAWIVSTAVSWDERRLTSIACGHRLGFGPLE